MQLILGLYITFSHSISHIEKPWWNSTAQLEWGLKDSFEHKILLLPQLQLMHKIQHNTWIFICLKLVGLLAVLVFASLLTLSETVFVSPCWLTLSISFLKRYWRFPSQLIYLLINSDIILLRWLTLGIITRLNYNHLTHAHLN